jgi:hypothetical protein
MDKRRSKICWLLGSEEFDDETLSVGRDEEPDMLGSIFDEYSAMDHLLFLGMLCGWFQ